MKRSDSLWRFACGDVYLIVKTYGRAVPLMITKLFTDDHFVSEKLLLYVIVGLHFLLQKYISVIDLINLLLTVKCILYSVLVTKNEKEEMEKEYYCKRIFPFLFVVIVKTWNRAERLMIITRCRLNKKKRCQNSFLCFINEKVIFVFVRLQYDSRKTNHTKKGKNN